MSGQVKKAWVAPFATCEALAVLTVESLNPGGIGQLRAEEMSFPANPSPEHPLHHIVKILLLDEEGLILIRDAINKYLDS